LRRPEGTLIALTTTNDPFHATTPGRVRRAEWFTALWEQFGFGLGVHIRRVHYRIISQETPILMVDGSTPYLNTTDCWQQVKEACRDARLLGMVNHDGFLDRRNKETFEKLDDREESPAQLFVTNTYIDISRPELPRLRLQRPTILQPYHLEIIVEKTTADDIIEPLAERYGINATSCAGQISLTRCFEIVQRAKASGRPVRILYVTDFDPAGHVFMPVACARKIEFLLRDGNLDLDIQLRQIVLTPEQCQEYRLPRTPLKSTAETKSWKDRFGEGATELDALEALHPGRLRQILVEEIERYYDTDLDDEISETAREIDADLHVTNIDAAASVEADLQELDRDCAALEERTKALYQGVITNLYEADDADVDNVEWPEPKDGDEDPDPLYDSKRTYVEQIDRYKRHQGKLTTRAPGKRGPGRKGRAEATQPLAAA